MIHRDALDKAEDQRMELFREARKRKKLSHGQVNERCQKHCDKTERANDPLNDNDNESVGSLCSSADSLCSIFCQIERQDDNIAESERRLIQARKDVTNANSTV